MKIVDAGQFAKGFFAFGQFATGVIVIGQFGMGVIAIGQFSFGLLLGVGMGSASLLQTYAMFGIGGRRGFGGVVQLIPSVGKPRVLPATTTLAAIEQAGEGWTQAEIDRDATTGFPVLKLDGRPEPRIKLDHRVAGGALGVYEAGIPAVVARIERHDGQLVCTRLMRVPPPPYREKSFPVMATVQLAVYAILAAVWWFVVGIPLLED